MMTIVVNGQVIEVPAALPLPALLDHLGMHAERVVVERNEAIVSRCDYGTAVLAAGDRLEILGFVGGG